MIKADNYNYPYYERTGILCIIIIGIESLLGYKSKYVGNWRVVEHPEFGTKIYPASFFTTYPIQIVEDSIEKVVKDIFNYLLK